MSDSSSSSSYESSSEEEQPQAKPIFISQKQKPTQSQPNDQRKRDVLLSKLSTNQTITSETESKKEEYDGVDDTDDLNPEEEYNAWKSREIMRFNRDQELIIQREMLKEEALARK